jgi:hypothetical protein
LAGLSAYGVICDHRYRRVHTLDGPAQLVCELNPCPDPPLSWVQHDQEPRNRGARRPTELGDRLGRLLLDRKSTVLSTLGGSLVPSELLDDNGIKISHDAISNYIHRYQVMLAARQQDPENLRRQ